MVQVNITSPFTAGLNAANEAAGGVLAQQSEQQRLALAREQLDLSRQTQEHRARILDEEAAQRRAEIERLASERTGRLAANTKYLEMLGQQFEPVDNSVRTGSDTFFGRPFETSRPTDERAQFQDFLKKNRQGVQDAAASISDPNARRAFLEAAIPMTMADEQAELEGFARRQVSTRLKEVMGSEFLDDEERQVVALGLQGLESGAEDPRTINAMLRDLRRGVTRRLTRQQNYQWGTQWAQQQINEAAMGGVDVTPLHEAFSDWVTSDDLDPQRLKKAILSKRYGLDFNTRKLGRREVPTNISLDAWTRLATIEAEREANDMAARDPEIAGMMKANKGVFTDEEKKKLADVRRSYAIRALEGMGLEWGVAPDQLDALTSQAFPAEQPTRDALKAELEKRLQAAGVTDTSKLREPLPRPKGETVSDRFRGPKDLSKWYDGVVSKRPDQYKPKPDGRDVNGDGVYDEEDIAK